MCTQELALTKSKLYGPPPERTPNKGDPQGEGGALSLMVADLAEAKERIQLLYQQQQWAAERAHVAESDADFLREKAPPALAPAHARSPVPCLSCAPLIIAAMTRCCAWEVLVLETALARQSQQVGLPSTHCLPPLPSHTWLQGNRIPSQ